MALFFKRSQTWVIDYRYEGRPRRWIKVWPAGTDAAARARQELGELFEGRAWLEQVRPASAEEEARYLAGEDPANPLCPSGRAPRSPAGEG
jgi:hypothetical protein